MHNKKSLTLLIITVLFFAVTNLYAQQQSVIKPIDKSELEKIIQQREGKPLFVNLWATWCVPCREEFPALIKLKKKYAEQTDIIAISVDYPDEIESKIIPFLSSFKINFPVYVNSFEKQEDLINFLNESWFGSLPATFIYDEKGKQQFFINGKEEYEFFADKIETLLKR
ncbi:MAG: TlpA disulfide reductase family protein [Melioribacteraceae bacterium]|nr:TlpA family protein disulfide reductase [Melioribacteraceae bacterium]MDD3558095.1 TlpA disulfide reductase family protein [Melioribacteraceae bacterium]